MVDILTTSPLFDNEAVISKVYKSLIISIGNSKLKYNGHLKSYMILSQSTLVMEN